MADEPNHPDWQLSGLQADPNGKDRPVPDREPMADVDQTMDGVGRGSSPFPNETIDTVRTGPTSDATPLPPERRGGDPLGGAGG